MGPKPLLTSRTDEDAPACHMVFAEIDLPPSDTEWKAAMRHSRSQSPGLQTPVQRSVRFDRLLDEIRQLLAAHTFYVTARHCQLVS